MAKRVSIRDIFLIAGFTALGAGLWLYDPRLSLTACGLLLLAGGFFMREAK